MGDHLRMPIPKKVCSRCGKALPATPDYFQRDGKGGDGFRHPCKACRGTTSHPEADPFGKLVSLTRSKPLPFVELCNRLDLSPGKTKALIAAAKTSGLLIKVDDHHVGLQVPVEDERVQATGIMPVVGKRQKVGVISDTHLGSKYCLRAELKDFVEYAYSQGVREILHPGDMLDGNYVSHGMFELSHVGLQPQIQDLVETLPKKPGLSYHAITGNHDLTFMEQNGVDVGRSITNEFKRAGRDDFHFYGNRGAFIKIRGAVVHLWHPMGGGSYAKSYKLQKQIEKYASGEKPHIVLAGHWHIYCHVYERGVHALACPTFQGGGSAFGKALGGAPTIGGMILSWEQTAHGTMRNFIHEYRAYFENEKPQQLFTEEAYRDNR